VSWKQERSGQTIFSGISELAVKGDFQIVVRKKMQKFAFFLLNLFIFEVLYLIVNQSYKAFWPAKR